MAEPRYMVGFINGHGPYGHDEFNDFSAEIHDTKHAAREEMLFAHGWNARFRVFAITETSDTDE